MRWISLWALLFLAGTGCSTFNRDWKSAKAAPGLANDIQGRWQGSWVSHTNSHHGRLRCLLSQENDGHYSARFHANYLRILSFTYSVPLAVQQTNGAYDFRGEADLGRLAGGLYSYEGQATPTNFFSTYHSKGDGGIFQMNRP